MKFLILASFFAIILTAVTSLNIVKGDDRPEDKYKSALAGDFDDGKNIHFLNLFEIF